MKSLIKFLLTGLLFAGSVSAGEAVNKKCPVSGKDVDATKTSEVSVKVGLCCAKCQAKFEGDAKMKTDAIHKHAGSKDSPVNTKCPISNKDVNKDNVATASTTVAFCCDKCKAEFDKDPKKYISKVK